MARRKESVPDATTSERSGWAHWRRVGTADLEFIEMCPAESGMCERKDVRHGWFMPPAKSRPRTLAELNAPYNEARFDGPDDDDPRLTQEDDR